MGGGANMRWSDEYLGLIAAALGVGAVVAWAAEVPWVASATFLALAGGALAGMLWRVTHTPRVLLVAEPPDRPLRDMHEALDEAGLAITFCPGPTRRACPVLHGRPCDAKGHPAVALLYRRSRDVGPRPPCGSGLGVPTLSMWGSDGGGGETRLPEYQQAQIVEVVRGLADARTTGRKR